MLVGEIVRYKPARIHEDAAMKAAAEIMMKPNQGDIIVVNSKEEFVGTLSRGDLIRAMIPDVQELYQEKISYRGLNEFFAKNALQKVNFPIKPYIIRDPITLKSTDPAVKAAVIMINLNIGSLPVVDDGKVTGLVTRADILKILSHGTSGGL